VKRDALAICSVVFVCAFVLGAMQACYQCKRPDCSDMPPGGEYPELPAHPKDVEPPPARDRDGGPALVSLMDFVDVHRASR
jgi:hypothetical protein